MVNPRVFVLISNFVRQSIPTIKDGAIWAIGYNFVSTFWDKVFNRHE